MTTQAHTAIALAIVGALVALGLSALIGGCEPLPPPDPAALRSQGYADCEQDCSQWLADGTRLEGVDLNECVRRCRQRVDLETGGAP